MPFGISGSYGDYACVDCGTCDMCGLGQQNRNPENALRCGWADEGLSPFFRDVHLNDIFKRLAGGDTGGGTSGFKTLAACENFKAKVLGDAYLFGDESTFDAPCWGNNILPDSFNARSPQVSTGYISRCAPVGQEEDCFFPDGEHNNCASGRCTYNLLKINSTCAA